MVEAKYSWLYKNNAEARIFKTDQDVLEVRRLYMEGFSCNQIARMFHCSKYPVLKLIKDLPKRKSGDYSQNFFKNQGFGKDHHSWKGGYKSIYDRFRDLNKYWLWRNEVLSRDSNKCTQCSSTQDLHAHHIVYLKTLVDTYIKTNDLVIENLTEEHLLNDYFYNTNNGLTLCELCHKKWHKEHGK